MSSDVEPEMEVVPPGADLQKRFHEFRPLRQIESGTLYAAEDENFHCLVVDERLLVDLSQELELIQDELQPGARRILKFPDAETRDAYIVARGWDKDHVPAEMPESWISKADRVRGSLLGGAIGDALGGPIEFLSREEILRTYGPDGVHDFVEAEGQMGLITDDTQMTLFTAEGLLRAFNRFCSKGVASVPHVVHHAYLRWLHTQGETSRSTRFAPNRFDGWLVTLDALYARRAPGNTCLSALRGEEVGRIGDGLNDSKGCGGVMRIAPVGLFTEINDPFRAGREIAAITHGHPTGNLAAGFLARLIRNVLEDVPLSRATTLAREELQQIHDADEVLLLIDRAQAEAELGPAPEAVDRLGQGWVAEEALGIGLYCSLVARDFMHGVCLAVNHSGDSDSTGAITGNILGALWGVSALPTPLLDRLHLREEIDELASDLALAAPSWDKYPGW